jgi:PBSX family phage terminase large subunit
MNQTSSTPSLSEFDPRDVPYQYDVLDDVRNNYDYSKGCHEVLLSGSVGSAKSLLMAHIIVTHCLENSGARFCLGRKAMPDLKATIFQKILEHIEGDLVEGEDYQVNHTSATIYFANGSEIISRSWSDKKYKKLRSLELSGACIEELTENNDEDKNAYDELKMRVGRLPHIKETLMISATNPDAPSHWAYKYFIVSESDTRHVYYSVTTDNKFLPPQYISQLMKDLDPKMAQRMIYGKWIEIVQEVVYYNYNRDIHYRDSEYTINPDYPVRQHFDFNIGAGKPMSSCFTQYINDHWHVFDEVVIQGADTGSAMTEAWERGLLNKSHTLIIHGDSAGNNHDTRSKVTDYEIIKNFLLSKRIGHEMRVLPANPPIRRRHNNVNAYLLNAEGRTRVTVYKNAKTMDEGLRLVKLKNGGQYLEDDSKYYQHITTAFGYGLDFECLVSQRKPQSTHQR